MSVEESVEESVEASVKPVIPKVSNVISGLLLVYMKQFYDQFFVAFRPVPNPLDFHKFQAVCADLIDRLCLECCIGEPSVKDLKAQCQCYAELPGMLSNVVRLGKALSKIHGDGVYDTELAARLYAKLESVVSEFSEYEQRYLDPALNGALTLQKLGDALRANPLLAFAEGQRMVINFEKSSQKFATKFATVSPDLRNTGVPRWADAGDVVPAGVDPGQSVDVAFPRYSDVELGSSEGNFSVKAEVPAEGLVKDPLAGTTLAWAELPVEDSAEDSGDAPIQ